MSFEPASRSGALLYRLLPLIYRRWDGRGNIDARHPAQQTAKGDLAEYLDAVGVVLDRLRGTIDQRLDDLSPETCQPWLIPYFADLLDVRLVSPDVDGQRIEVARAVAWRQRKGTLSCIEEVARSVGRFERIALDLTAGPAPAGAPASYQPFSTLVVHEGFRRVATTAVVGRPLPSLTSLGMDPAAFPDTPSPIEAARRPGLPAGTVDFRLLSRARAAAPAGTRNGFQHDNAFGDVAVRWQMENPRGAPCRPETYQDASVRTADMRTPDHARGHYHPRRILLHAAPRDGFFTPGALEVDWDWLCACLGPETAGDQAPAFTGQERDDGFLRERVLRRVLAPAETIVIQRELERRDGSAAHQLIVGRPAPDDQPALASRNETVDGTPYAFVAGFELMDELTAPGAGGAPASIASRTLGGFGDKTPVIRPVSGGAALSLHDLASAVPVAAYGLRALVVRGAVDGGAGPLALDTVAVESLTVAGAPAPGGADSRPLTATSSLFARLAVSGGAARLEYCTVMESLACPDLEASDSILLGADAGAFTRLLARYCAAPWLPAEPAALPPGRTFQTTRARPLFLDPRYGLPGCAVLHPAVASAIRAGAEDGGELGAYHGQHHVLREQAVLDKLRELSPVNMTPVLITHRPWTPPIPAA